MGVGERKGRVSGSGDFKRSGRAGEEKEKIQHRDTEGTTKWVSGAGFRVSGKKQKSECSKCFLKYSSQKTKKFEVSSTETQRARRKKQNCF
jgi:hypothetical protein